MVKAKRKSSNSFVQINILWLMMLISTNGVITLVKVVINNNNKHNINNNNNKKAIVFFHLLYPTPYPNITDTFYIIRYQWPWWLGGRVSASSATGYGSLVASKQWHRKLVPVNSFAGFLAKKGNTCLFSCNLVAIYSISDEAWKVGYQWRL